MPKQIFVPRRATSSAIVQEVMTRDNQPTPNKRKKGVQRERRPTYPSDSFRAFSFKTPPQFNKLFRDEARKREMKLNEFLEYCVRFTLQNASSE